MIGTYYVYSHYVYRLQYMKMTRGEIDFDLVRIIKTPRAVARHAAQQIGVVVVLPAQKLLVLVQLVRNTDLVAGGAKLRGFVQRFEEGSLVKLGFGFDELVV